MNRYNNFNSSYKSKPNMNRHVSCYSCHSRGHTSANCPQKRDSHSSSYKNHHQHHHNNSNSNNSQSYFRQENKDSSHNKSYHSPNTARLKHSSSNLNSSTSVMTKPLSPFFNKNKSAAASGSASSSTSNSTSLNKSRSSSNSFSTQQNSSNNSPLKNSKSSEPLRISTTLEAKSEFLEEETSLAKSSSAADSNTASVAATTSNTSASSSVTATASTNSTSTAKISPNPSDKTHSNFDLTTKISPSSGYNSSTNSSDNLKSEVADSNKSGSQNSNSDSTMSVKKSQASIFNSNKRLSILNRNRSITPKSAASQNSTTGTPKTEASDEIPAKIDKKSADASISSGRRLLITNKKPSVDSDTKSQSTESTLEKLKRSLTSDSKNVILEDKHVGNLLTRVLSPDLILDSTSKQSQSSTPDDFFLPGSPSALAAKLKEQKEAKKTETKKKLAEEKDSSDDEKDLVMDVPDTSPLKKQKPESKEDEEVAKINLPKAKTFSISDLKRKSPADSSKNKEKETKKLVSESKLTQEINTPETEEVNLVVFGDAPASPDAETSAPPKKQVIKNAAGPSAIEQILIEGKQIKASKTRISRNSRNASRNASRCNSPLLIEDNLPVSKKFDIKNISKNRRKDSPRVEDEPPR